MTTYIDPITDLPQNLGEIYSDRNIRIVGQARLNPLNPNQIDTLGVQILCTPIGGGAEGVSNITNGTYTLSGVGSSLWVKIQRSGTATVTPEIYAAGLQPKSRRDYVQVFYQSTANHIVSVSSFMIYAGPLYTRFGYVSGQRIYDAIVGDSGDDHVTHTDLQTAINDVANNSWILIKKTCIVATNIGTNGKTLKFVFNGSGTGLQQLGGATVGITFDAAGCQLVGFGKIYGFSTGVNLNNQTGSRIEMVFSSNSTNINFGSLNGTQYSVNGSYGLTETSHIETSVLEGVLGRWNNTSKRWEPVSNIGGQTILVNTSGVLISTGTIQSAFFSGNGVNITALNMNNAGSGTLIVGRGGTGVTSFTSKGILYGNSTSALQVTGAGGQYQVLQAGSGSTPVFAALNLSQAAAVTGTLPVGRGGTGVVSFTSKGILYGNTTGALQVTGAGGQYQVLQAGSGGTPVFAALNLGQAAAVTGTLPVHHGGTGVTTSTGTGNTVRSAGPTFTGTVSADIISANKVVGAVYQ